MLRFKLCFFQLITTSGRFESQMRIQNLTNFKHSKVLFTFVSFDGVINSFVFLCLRVLMYAFFFLLFQVPNEWVSEHSTTLHSDGLETSSVRLQLQLQSTHFRRNGLVIRLKCIASFASLARSHTLANEALVFRHSSEQPNQSKPSLSSTNTNSVLIPGGFDRSDPESAINSRPNELDPYRYGANGMSSNHHLIISSNDQIPHQPSSSSSSSSDFAGSSSSSSSSFFSSSALSYIVSCEFCTFQPVCSIFIDCLFAELRIRNFDFVT